MGKFRLKSYKPYDSFVFVVVATRSFNILNHIVLHGYKDDFIGKKKKKKDLSTKNILK